MEEQEKNRSESWGRGSSIRERGTEYILAGHHSPAALPPPPTDTFHLLNTTGSQKGPI